MASAESPPTAIKLKHLSKNNITLMLVGAAGAGKSSLINSLIKLVQLSDVSPNVKLNSYIPTASARLMGGHTLMREPVNLTETLTILDNRGWHDWTNKVAIRELTAQIRGERSLIDDVNWEKGVEDAPPYAVSPKVDCISIVINGEGGIEAVEGIRDLIDICRKSIGRRPSVVITHKDGVTDEHLESMTDTLESYAIGRGNIFVVQNVTIYDDNLEADSASSLCKFIERCNIDGDVGVKYNKIKEETNLKMEESLKEQEAKDRSKEITKLKHEAEATQYSEAKIQIKMKTETEQQRRDTEEDILQANKQHAKDMNEIKKKDLLHSNKISNDIYTQYLTDAYAKELSAIKGGSSAK